MNSITIKKIINGGQGLAKQDNGKTLLVKHVLPNEVISYKAVEEKKKYSTAKLKSVLEPHPERITPPCPHYLICGGCDLMHCSYMFQLDTKHSIIKDIFNRSRTSELELFVEDIKAPLPSSNELYYRQRIRLFVNEYQELGFRKANSHEIVPISKCLLADEVLNKVLFTLVSSTTTNELIEFCETVELMVNPLNQRVTLLFNFTRKPRPTDRKRGLSLVEGIEEVDCILFSGKDFAPINIGGEQDEQKQILQFEIQTNDSPDTSTSLTWEAGGFCQVNISQNMVMISNAIEMLAPEKSDSILDLFCGMGNFSIPLAKRVHRIVGVEGQGSSIRSAKRNSLHNSTGNTSFIKSDIYKACDSLIEKGEQFDHVLLDPPRAGAPGLIDKICKLANKKILYVSCDPATLARDLVEFIKLGFGIECVQPVDMFPQTHHIETMVLLTRTLK